MSTAGGAAVQQQNRFVREWRKLKMGREQHSGCGCWVWSGMARAERFKMHFSELGWDLEFKWARSTRKEVVFRWCHCGSVTSYRSMEVSARQATYGFALRVERAHTAFAYVVV
jgi:hypothetical protein